MQKGQLQKSPSGTSLAKQSPVGVELIDNTLQIITSMQQQRKDIEQENEGLRQRLAEAEAVSKGQDYEKAKYMEGAVWLGKKLTNEIEKLCHAVDSITGEFQQRVNTE